MCVYVSKSICILYFSFSFGSSFLFTYFTVFLFCFDLLLACLFSNERKKPVDLGVWGRRRDQERIVRGETVIRIYCTKTCFQQKLKIKKEIFRNILCYGNSKSKIFKRFLCVDLAIVEVLSVEQAGYKLRELLASLCLLNVRIKSVHYH